jgi:hypothetical protein
MYKVLIGLKEVARTESLAEACQIFIQKVQEMIRNGGTSEYVLYEACMIEGEFPGFTGMMNFDAIRGFSHATGILNKDGSLRNKPVPYIPPDWAREIFEACFQDSFEAYLAEKEERFAKMAAANEGLPVPEEIPEPEVTIIVASA